METNEILTTLANLETSLKEIDAAKKQVEDTVAAYKGIYPHIDAYVGELGKVSEEILSVIGELKANTNSLKDASKQAVDKLNTESLIITSNFSSSCKVIVENLATIAKSIASESKDLLDKSFANLDISVLKMQHCINELSILGKEIMNATELVSDLKNDVNVLSKELRDSQYAQDKQLQRLVDDIAISQKNQDDELEKIKQLLSTIHTNHLDLNKVLASQEEKMGQLLTAQKNNKKLTVIILLVVLITSAGLLLFRYY